MLELRKDIFADERDDNLKEIGKGTQRQDMLGHVWKPIGRTSSYPSVLATSVVMVAMWGWFLWQGIHDPLGGMSIPQRRR